LARLVHSFLGEAVHGGQAPKAIIAPHAGYIYSGPIAGTVYARLAPARSVIRRVVLLGPSHRVYVRGLAAPEAQVFAMPFGAVPVDRDALDQLRDLPQVIYSDEAHAPEHGLEVHLPFLQTVLDDFRIAPLVVGDATPQEVAEVLERLWGGPETLIVISSDLSHYYDYDTARRMDEATSKAIEALRPEDIGPEQACGRIPIQGLLLVAREKGLCAKLLDLRSSGDTAGPRDQVVGYGVYALA
jgi:MEMO1 family protein